MKDKLIRLVKEDVSKFYNSTAWKRMREQILRRDNFECQHCKKKGKVTTQNLQVHHIKEVKQYPELGLEPSNLITICARCHNLEHDKNGYGNCKKDDPITTEMW